MTRIAALMALLAATSMAEAGEPVTYDANGITMEGYFAEAAQPAAGTIMILPTWKGVSDYEKDRADMLARAGYDAFVGDLHGQGQLPRSLEEMQAAYSAIWTEQERLHGMLQAAATKAMRLGGQDVVVLGYSMGGGAAMELARSGLGMELGVDGYAVFSGRVSDPAGRMIPDGTAPIFVAHGEMDQRLPVSGLINFQNNLDFTDVDYEVNVYPGKKHLFSAFGFPNYDEAADAESWQALMGFLSRVFPTAASES